MYKIIDNFLEENEFKKIQSFMLSDYIPWYFNDYVVDKEKDLNLNNYQLTHTFYKNFLPTSENFIKLVPLIEKINPSALIRIKANLVPRTEKINEHGWHIDNSLNCKTAVYYINTNDGYTKFKNGDIVESIENRLVIFDSGMEHTGSSCTNEKIRCVINLNFIPLPHEI